MGSKPVFLSRLASAGIGQAEINLFVAGNIDTLSRLAYSSSATPGSGDETPFLAMLCRIMRKPEDQLDDGLLAAIREIWYECHTVAVSEIKHKVEATAIHCLANCRSQREQPALKLKNSDSQEFP